MTRPGARAFDVAVVGGGILGLATAYRLLVGDPRRRIVVLEKESRVGLHQSTHNSGVLHAGVYYDPGSLKARLCAQGKRMMEGFASEHGVPVVPTGKLIVALEEAELGRFRALAERARENRVPGLRELGTAELREIEPHAEGLRALHSPGTAAVDFGRVCEALATEIGCRGAEVRTSARVLAVTEGASGVRLVTSAGDMEAKVLVACAGLQADRLAALTGHGSGVRIIPFRGSWYALRPEVARLVRGNIYPVPDPRFPFLGVHFTRRVDGSVWVGPNAVLAGGRETYRRGSVNLADLAATATFVGFWRLGPRLLRTGIRELYRDRFRRAYLREVRRYLPEVGLADLVPGPTGIRAQAVRANGQMVDDFLIEGTARVVHVLNAPSPAATSSLAIGELLAEEVSRRL